MISEVRMVMIGEGFLRLRLEGGGMRMVVEDDHSDGLFIVRMMMMSRSSGRSRVIRDRVGGERGGVYGASPAAHFLRDPLRDQGEFADELGRRSGRVVVRVGRSRAYGGGA